MFRLPRIVTLAYSKPLHLHHFWFSDMGLWVLIDCRPVARGALTRSWHGRGTLREKTDNYLKVLVRNREDKIDEEIIGRVENVAKKMGKGMAQIAIAWCLSKKDVCPIVGLNKKERMDEAVEACKIKLSEEDIKYLEEPYMPKKRQGY